MFQYDDGLITIDVYKECKTICFKYMADKYNITTVKKYELRN